MCGGGGGGAPPPRYIDSTTGMEYGSAQEMNDAISSRSNKAAADAAAAQAQAAAAAQARQAEEAATLQRNNETRNTRLQDAKNNIISQLYANTGLTGDKFLSDVETAYTGARSKIPEGAINVGDYLDVGGTVNNIMSNQLTRLRNDATSRASSLFAPGFENSYLADTADDPIIDKILNESFATFQTGLDNAKKRGTLNDIGFTAARGALDTDRTKAAATLQALGSDILSSGRSSIAAIGNEARTRAGSLNFRDSFDPESYASRARSTASDFLSTLEGRLRNSVDPSTFSDLQRLLNNGGSAQGPLGGGNVAFDEDNRRRRSDQRGLGSTGAF